MSMTHQEDISAFPFLRTFAESKPLVALLLQAIHHQVPEKYKTGRLCFPPPINKELEHLSRIEYSEKEWSQNPRTKV
jgi:hypothetical protein